MAIRHRKKQSNTRLWLLIALLVAVCAVIFLLPAGEPTTAAPAAQTEAEDEVAATTLVKVGEMAPDFTVTMFDGSTVTLSELKGKVVWLNFWATWCPPCREELKRVQQDVIDRYADEPFVFLPISRGETHETVAAFREQQGYTFAMGLDPERKIYDRFASNYIPRNFLIDKEGRIAMVTVGYEPEEFDLMVEAVQLYLPEK